MNLREQEAAKYAAVWKNPQYREVSPGLRHLPSAMKWMQPEQGASITDWGSGSGQAADAMAAMGYAVRCVDIASNAYRGPLPFVEACLWELPASLDSTDYGFCTDVMEHIPTEHVDAVLDGIARRTEEKCYFQIALFEDHFYSAHGQLHLSVFPPEWWEQKLSRHFKGFEGRMIRRRHFLAVAW